ncbi:hypothetical protein [Isoptericola rhizosphaerae]|uniref:hypothetical protein n=1 Tax=Isoptericola rhizosphaerae TaxID=3377837 RepID=UPI00383BF208
MSSDSADWTKVAAIVGDAQPTREASFLAQTARHVKAVNTGSADRWWSITEFTAYAKRVALSSEPGSACLTRALA